MPDQLKNLSEAELEDIRRRCEQATPGPWQSFIEGRDHTSGCSFIMTGRGKNRGSDIELTGATPADHDFIAHARQDVPRLLEEISQLTDFSLYARRERERLNQERTAALGLQRELNRRLAEIERELSAIDAYTAAKGTRPERKATFSGTRHRVSRSGKREQLLQLLRQHSSGLSRSEILEKMGLKGDRVQEVSISSTLTALIKTGEVARDPTRKYIPR